MLEVSLRDSSITIEGCMPDTNVGFENETVNDTEFVAVN